MRYLPVLLIFLVALGCASTSDVAQVQGDVNSVYREAMDYRQRTDARLSKIEREMGTLNTSIGSTDEGLRKQLLDLSVSVENKDEKIKTILGRLDELESQLRTYWDETRTEMREFKKLKEGGGPPKADVTRGNYEEAYKEAFEAYQKGFYDDATRRFSDFLKSYPDTPLSPNAFYWIGEGYMNLKDYEKAIVAFQEVIDKYPKSEKAPRSFLRQAEAFREIGDKKSSTTLLKRIVELFPKSEEARVADRLLRSGGLQ